MTFEGILIMLMGVVLALIVVLNVAHATYQLKRIADALEKRSGHGEGK